MSVREIPNIRLRDVTKLVKKAIPQLGLTKGLSTKEYIAPPNQVERSPSLARRRKDVKKSVSMGAL